MYCHGEFQHSMAYSSAMLMQALRSVADKVNTRALSKEDDASRKDVPALFVSDGLGGGSGYNTAEGLIGMPAGSAAQVSEYPFVVFNLTGHERTEMVEFTLWERNHWETVHDFRNRQFMAVLADGRCVETFCTENNQFWAHAFKKILLPLTVPAFGFTTVVFKEWCTGALACDKNKDTVRTLSMKHHCSYAVTERPVLGMENGTIKALWDSVTGKLVSLVDKSTGIDLLAGGKGVGPEMTIERPIGMSAWVIGAAGEQVSVDLKKVQEFASGDYTAALVFSYAFARSHMSVTYRLDAGASTLKVSMDITWLEVGTDQTGIPNLRFCVGTALKNPTATYEIPFGAIQRTTAPHHDVPALRWTLLESKALKAGLLVTNDCKYGNVVQDGTLTINLLRSSYNPDPLPELRAHKCGFTLTPVKVAEDIATLIRTAQATENPLIPIGTDTHDGTIAPEEGMLEVTGDGIVLSCVKNVEQAPSPNVAQAPSPNVAQAPSPVSKEIIIRLYNTRPKAAVATVAANRLFGRLQKASLADLLERPTKTLPLRGQSVAATVPANGIATVRLAFA